MNASFAKLNVLDSKSITDTHHYSKLVDQHNTIFDFYSNDDLKFADVWPHQQFNYVLNEHGFRFEEIPSEVDLAAFGCSFTFGLGLPNEMLWHNIIAQELNLSCLNFGLCGSPIKTITDIFFIVSKHIKIRRAIFLLPSLIRTQIAKTHPLIDKIDYLNAMPVHKSMLCESYSLDTDQYYKYVPEEELYKDAKEAIYLSEYIAKDRNIDIYYGSWDPDTVSLLKLMDFKNGILLPNWWTPPELVDDVARDKMHPGPEHHKYWANTIKPFIK